MFNYENDNLSTFDCKNLAVSQVEKNTQENKEEPKVQLYRPLNQEEREFLESTRYEKTKSVRAACPIMFQRPSYDLSCPLMQKNVSEPEYQAERKTLVSDLPFVQSDNVGFLSFVLRNIDSVTEFWTTLTNHLLASPNVDPIVSKRQKRVFGNVYDNCTHAEFLLTLCQTEVDPYVLNVQRLRGNGFALEKFYENLRDFLKSSNLIQQEEEMDLDSDDDELEDEFLCPGGYLQLSFDPTLVPSWLHKLSQSTIADQQHVMGLMAHNAKLEENRNIMLANQTLILEHVVKVLETKNAALMRNCSLLLSELAPFLEFNKPLVQSCFQAMRSWAPKNGEPKDLQIRESREAVLNLQRFVTSQARDVTYLKDCVTTYLNEEAVRESIKDVLTWKGETDSVLMPMLAY